MAGCPVQSVNCFTRAARSGILLETLREVCRMKHSFSFISVGPIRMEEVDTGNTPESRRTAYIDFEDLFDAKNVCDHLLGFNVCSRYFVVLSHNENRAFQKLDMKEKEEQLKLLEKYGINMDPLK